MDRLVLVAVLVVVAGVVAAFFARRRPDAPTQPDWTVPSVVDRSDFDRPDAPWLVAVFTSATCATCHGVIEAARPLESPAVVVMEIEHDERRDLHDRYGVDAVPPVVIADGAGVVQGSYVGPVTAADLWAKVAEIRDEPD
jgi:hypothetical protein